MGTDSGNAEASLSMTTGSIMVAAVSLLLLLAITVVTISFCGNRNKRLKATDKVKVRFGADPNDKTLSTSPYAPPKATLASTFATTSVSAPVLKLRDPHDAKNIQNAKDGNLVDENETVGESLMSKARENFTFSAVSNAISRTLSRSEQRRKSNISKTSSRKSRKSLAYTRRRKSRRHKSGRVDGINELARARLENSDLISIHSINSRNSRNIDAEDIGFDDIQKNDVSAFEKNTAMKFESLADSIVKNYEQEDNNYLDLEMGKARVDPEDEEAERKRQERKSRRMKRSATWGSNTDRSEFEPEMIDGNEENDEFGGSPLKKAQGKSKRYSQAVLGKTKSRTEQSKLNRNKQKSKNRGTVLGRDMEAAIQTIKVTKKPTEESLSSIQRVNSNNPEGSTRKVSRNIIGLGLANTKKLMQGPLPEFHDNIEVQFLDIEPPGPPPTPRLPPPPPIDIKDQKCSEESDGHVANFDKVTNVSETKEPLDPLDSTGDVTAERRRSVTNIDKILHVHEMHDPVADDEEKYVSADDYLKHVEAELSKGKTDKERKDSIFRPSMNFLAKSGVFTTGDIEAEAARMELERLDLEKTGIVKEPVLLSQIIDDEI